MTDPEGKGIIRSSFRDPSGFLFVRDGKLYRQINTGYREHYDRFLSSGLYDFLTKSELLVPHEEVEIEPPRPDTAYRIIKPQKVPFISYPYEWCFGQLKDAALATLDIQRHALDYGMSLKDGSSYNIQFIKCKPVLIDTLSFETYAEGTPWVAYRQFCQHFLAPLALMSYRDIRLGRMLRIYIDGIPLDLASSLLPLAASFKFSLFSHIRLHAKSQEHFADKSVETKVRKVSRLGMLGLIDSLRSAVRGLRWKARGTEWAEYYDDTNYSIDSLNHKVELVAEFLERVKPERVWDLGANEGMFSRVAAGKGIPTISFDIDPAAVEKNYRECVRKGEVHILPLLLDLTNPSPGLGWEHNERMSLLDRGPTDAALALALIHHLAISNNLPLLKIADFFRKTCSSLIIEFVPKTDSQVRRLLTTREDIFDHYTEEHFEEAFGEYFQIETKVPVKQSQRVMYLMKKK